MAKPPYNRSPATQPPADAREGAAHVRAYMLKLFHREDGEAADWPLITETLFRASFDALDKLPDDACKMVARRVQVGAYERVTEGPKGCAAPTGTGLDRARSAGPDTPDLNSRKPGR